MIKALRTVGRYFMLMGRTFSRPERMRMFFRQYLNELEQLGVNSIGIVLLISFFIGAVITIQIKLNIESPSHQHEISSDGSQCFYHNSHYLSANVHYFGLFLLHLPQNN